MKVNDKIVAMMNDEDQNIIEGAEYIIEKIESEYIVADGKKFTLMYESFLLASEVVEVTDKHHKEMKDHVNTILNFSNMSKKEQNKILREMKHSR
jgi:hypothetical protein